MEYTKHTGLLAAVLVSLIGAVGIVTIYTANGITGAAYEVNVDREYRLFKEQMCTDPNYPVPVFSQSASRVGNINLAFQGCVSEEEAVIQSGARFRGSRNRNKEATSAYAYEFTRAGSSRPLNGMIWAGY